MTFFELTGWLFGLVGTVVGIYAYLRTRNVVKISGSAVVTPELRSLTSLPQDVGVNINGSKIPGNLDVVCCVFKNTGTTTLRDKDIVEPLRIRLVSGVETSVAFAGLEGVSRKENKTLSLETSGSEVIVKWGYLDPGEKFKVVIIANGGAKGASFEGQFIGGGRVVTSVIRDGKDFLATILAIIVMLMILFGGSLSSSVGFVFNLDYPFWSSAGVVPDNFERIIVLSISGSLMVIISIAILVSIASFFSRFRKAIEKSAKK